MATHKASATWQGTLADGHGAMTVQGTTFSTSAPDRFEGAGGSSPEELLGAAHAQCFSMALSHQLSGAGHPPTAIDTQAEVDLEKGPGGFHIPRIRLSTQVKAPGVDPTRFQELAEAAKQGCPVSKLFQGADISLEATLVHD